MNINGLEAAFPDWRESSQYPDAAQLSVALWAWEFLRRNPHYQCDFEALSLEMDQDIRDRELLKAGLAYGIQGSMIDPRIPASELSGPLFRSASPRVIRNPTHLHTISKSEVAIVIDLTLPIDSQLKLISRRLIDEQFRLHVEARKFGNMPLQKRGYKKTRPEKYQSYLRMLDAKTFSDLSYQKIAEYVFPHLTNSCDPKAGSDQALHAYHAALRLRDGGYRYISMFSGEPIDH